MSFLTKNIHILLANAKGYPNASLLLEQGIDFKVIQTRLGHSYINTTLNIYSHINLKMQQSATEKLAAALSGGKVVAKKITPTKSE